MSSFFSVPAFDRRSPLGPGDAVGSVMIRAKMAVRTVNSALPAFDSAYPDLAGVPWGMTVYSTRNTVVPGVGNHNDFRNAVTLAQTARDSAQHALDLAVAAVTAAQTLANSKAAALASARASQQTAADAYDAARTERWRAGIMMQTATRRDDDDLLASAVTRSANAATLVTTRGSVLGLATEAVSAAVNDSTDAAGALVYAQIAREDAQQRVDVTTLVLTYAQDNLAAYEVACPSDTPSSPTDGSTPPPIYLSQKSADTAHSSLTAKAVSTAGAVLTHESAGHTVFDAVNYFTVQTRAVYQLVALIDDATFQLLRNSGLSVKIETRLRTVAAAVVTVTRDAGTPEYPYTYETAYTDDFQRPTQTLDPSGDPHVVALSLALFVDGVDLGLPGYHVGLGAETTVEPVAVADGGTVATTLVGGQPTLPQLSIEGRGVYYARDRVGWAEYTSAGGAPAVRRYRTLTATTIAGAPAGVSYSGSQTYTAAPGSPSFPLNPPVYTFASTMNAAAAAVANRQLPGSDARVDDGATVLSPTVREFTQPAGLRFTLSDEMTASEIATDAAAKVATVDPAHLNAFAAASFRRFSTDGNHAEAQHAQYRLGCDPGDPYRWHADTWAATFHYVRRTTDLGTGAVSNETLSVSFDVTGNTAAANPGAWLDLPLPTGNQRIEILAPDPSGSNGDPHTFAGLVGVLASTPTG